jgi:hypothetical protein
MLVTWVRIASGFATDELPTVDIYASDTDGQLALDRNEIRQDGELFDVRRPATSLPPQRLDEMLVTQLLTGALTGAAR